MAGRVQTKRLPNGDTVRVTFVGGEGGEAATCNTCGKPAGKPYRRRKGGEVLEGCVDACHDPYISGRERAHAVKARADIAKRGREK